MYNTGTISLSDKASDFIGGILGGTYYNCFGVKIDGINQIKYGYNYGTVSGNSNVVNQVCPNYATVTKIYYVSGKPNKSGYGTGLASNLFTSNAAGSVYYNLNQVTKNVWTINSAYNSGKVILLWQTTI